MTNIERKRLAPKNKMPVLPPDDSDDEPVTKKKMYKEPDSDDEIIVKKTPKKNDSDDETPKNEKPGVYTDIFISDYSPKSFLVLGNTLSHANALGKLGGTHTELRNMGLQWLFAGYKKDSVKKYIEEGIIQPAKWTGPNTWGTKANASPPAGQPDLSKIFEEFSGAFDKDAEYTGESVLEVIGLLRNKFLVKNA